MKTIIIQPLAAPAPAPTARTYAESGGARPVATAPTSVAVAEHHAQRERLLKDAALPGANAAQLTRGANTHAALADAHAALDAGQVEAAARHYGDAQAELAATRSLGSMARLSGLDAALTRAAQRLGAAQSMPTVVPVGDQGSVGVSAAQTLTYAHAPAAAPQAPAEHGTLTAEARRYAAVTVKADTAAASRAAQAVTAGCHALGRAYASAAEGDAARAYTQLHGARAALNGVLPQDLVPDTRAAYQDAVLGAARLEATVGTLAGEHQTASWRDRAREYAAQSDAFRVTEGTVAERRPVTALADALTSASRASAFLAAGDGPSARAAVQAATLSLEGAPAAALPRDAQLVRATLTQDLVRIREHSVTARQYAFEVPVEAVAAEAAPAPLPALVSADTPQVRPPADALLAMRDRCASEGAASRDVTVLSAFGALSRVYGSAYGVVTSELRGDGQAGTYRRRVKMAVSGLRTSGLIDRLPQWAKDAAAEAEALYG